MSLIQSKKVQIVKSFRALACHLDIRISENYFYCNCIVGLDLKESC